VTIWPRKHTRKTPSQAFTRSKKIYRIGWSLKFSGTVHSGSINWFDRLLFNFSFVVVMFKHRSLRMLMTLYVNALLFKICCYSCIIFFSLDCTGILDFRFHILAVCYMLMRCKFYAGDLDFVFIYWLFAICWCGANSMQVI